MYPLCDIHTASPIPKFLRVNVNRQIYNGIRHKMS